jgi:serine protease Do
MKAKVAVTGFLVATLFAVSFWAGMTQAPRMKEAHAQAATAAQPASAATGQAPSGEMRGAVQTLPDFAAIVERNKAAVVNITATVNRQASSGAGRPQVPQGPEGKPQGPEGRPQVPEGLPEGLEEFFRRFGEGGAMPERPMQGLGSGFIIDANGIILTNAHVVEGADEVRVRLTDRREFKGKVLGADRPTDLAVVKIEATGLPAVKIGNPRDLRVGEWVLAIGSPFGFENTVTAGILSATSRSLPEGTYVPFLQTDAAVNPGNSGGPIFNLKGEVIGIASQIYSRSGGYMGISFAIPADIAVSVKDQLIKTGKVERGRVGIAIQEVTAPLAKSFGLDKPMGGLVSTVEKGGPADKAGVKAGDVIVGVNGKAIDRSTEIPPLVAAIKPGTKANFDVWRDGKKQTLAVVVGELKEERPVAAAKPEGKGSAVDTGKLGLAVRPLSDAEKKQLGEGAGGVVVEAASGPAMRAGIRPGDLVTAVNGKPVKTADELKKLVEGSGGNVALLVKRGEANLFVPIEIG